MFEDIYKKTDRDFVQEICDALIKRFEFVSNTNLLYDCVEESLERYSIDDNDVVTFTYKVEVKVKK